MSISFVDLGAQYIRLKDDINRRIQVVMEHGQYIMGPEVTQLEECLSAFTGSKHVITTSSGTDALLAILMAKNIGQGDAVFLPAFTFPASAEIVALIGARPVFVDVQADTYNMDPASLINQIEHIKTSSRYYPKAIIATDLFGLPADYSTIGQIARQENMALIADAAQSFGSSQDGSKTGTLADATAVSFFPAKPLGCYGDGGAIFTDDDELADTLRSIRVHGRGDSKYEIQRIGLNARLDTIQAAILLSKLTIFNDELHQRKVVSDAYFSHLGTKVKAPSKRNGTNSAWAHYTIQLDNRDTIAATLQNKNIPTGIYYPTPMHMQSAYMAFGSGVGSLPTAEQLSRQVLSLPMHPYLKENDVERICIIIRSII